MDRKSFEMQVLCNVPSWCSFSKCPPGVSIIPLSESDLVHCFSGFWVYILNVFQNNSPSYSYRHIDSKLHDEKSFWNKKSCYHDCSLMEQWIGHYAEASRNIK